MVRVGCLLVYCQEIASEPHQKVKFLIEGKELSAEFNNIQHVCWMSLVFVLDGLAKFVKTFV